MRATRYVVTGGAGFIGSHVVDALLARQGAQVTVLDRLTYAGSLDNLSEHRLRSNFMFVEGDVAKPEDVVPLVRDADHVVHLAAESDVDRSLRSAAVFMRTNVIGTQVVLEACRDHRVPVLVVSTDGVYGSGAETGTFDEDAPLRPTNPYAASKAAADLLSTAFHSTFDLAVTVVRGTNAYGPRQHPEKGVPTFILAALNRRPIPVYGSGKQRREWLFVTDWAEACLSVLDQGAAGTVYNLGGGVEVSNQELAARICRVAGAPQSLIDSVADRPGHDFRYGLSWGRLADLGWSPRVVLDEGLQITTRWYAGHRSWVYEALQRTEGSAEDA